MNRFIDQVAVISGLLTASMAGKNGNSNCRQLSAAMLYKDYFNL